MRLPLELNVESGASFPFPGGGGGERWRERGVGRRGTLGTRLSQTGLKNTDQARVREPPSACLPILGCDNILVKSFLCMHNLKVIKMENPLRPEMGKQNLQAKDVDLSTDPDLER